MRVVVIEAEGDVEGWSYEAGGEALYWTTEQDSGRVVVDGVVEGWEVVGAVMDGETEGEGDE